jgi:hypothetical protein
MTAEVKMTGATVPEVYFDRRVHDEFLVLLESGFLRPLVERWRRYRPRYDLLLWASPKATFSSVSFYYGLTSILDVEFRPQVGSDGHLKLRAHRTHRRAGGFGVPWGSWRPAKEVEADWPAVEQYLTDVAGRVDPRWTSTEGAVHGALCAGLSPAYRAIGREASVGFRDIATQQAILEELRGPIDDAMKKLGLAQSLELTKPWLRPKPLGTGADLLATDPAGRLLVIEAKWHRAAGGVAWAPAQVRLYAEVVARWVETTPKAREILAGMLEQRQRLGLVAGTGREPLATRSVVPVVAVGDQPPSKEVQRRLWVVAQAINAAPSSNPLVAPVEVWFLDGNGHPTVVEPPKPGPAGPTTGGPEAS